jgi:hypothetical protein
MHEVLQNVDLSERRRTEGKPIACLSWCFHDCRQLNAKVTHVGARSLQYAE